MGHSGAGRGGAGWCGAGRGGAAVRGGAARERGLVEDVVVALVVGLLDDAGLLKKVRLDLRARDGGLAVEVDVNPLAEARRVVVAYRLGVAERLQHCHPPRSCYVEAHVVRGALCSPRHRRLHCVVFESRLRRRHAATR